MDVQTITMNPHEAQRRLHQYRKSLHHSADMEYAAAVAGYEALAGGTPVLQLRPTIRNAPRDEKGRPRIAVARADRHYLHFRWARFDSTASFSTLSSDQFWDYRRRNPDGLLLLDVNMGDQAREYTNGYALVPMVPPEAVAAAGGRSQLRHHLVVWEVEEWSDTPLNVAPDRDPLLVKVIHGDLCAVVAEWDLTELERAIMAGRVGA